MKGDDALIDEVEQVKGQARDLVDQIRRTLDQLEDVLKTTERRVPEIWKALSPSEGSE